MQTRMFLTDASPDDVFTDLLQQDGEWVRLMLELASSSRFHIPGGTVTTREIESLGGETSPTGRRAAGANGNIEKVLARHGYTGLFRRVGPDTWTVEPCVSLKLAKARLSV